MAGSSVSSFLSEPIMTMGLYLDMLDLYAVRQLPRETLIQRNGASRHYSHVMRKDPHHPMSGRWVSKGTSVAWPPRSPDVTPLDLLPMGVMWITSSTRSEMTSSTFESQQMGWCGYGNTQHTSKRGQRLNIAWIFLCHQGCPHWNLLR